MSNGITYEAIMALPLEEIRQSFPHGVREATPNRFVPADEGQATRELRTLERDKRRRIEKPRYLRASYSVPPAYVKNPDAKGGRNDNYTQDRAKALGGATEPEEGVPADVQKQFSQDAHLRDAERGLQVPLHEELRAIEDHLRPQQRAELRKRIEGFKRSTNEKAA